MAVTNDRAVRAARDLLEANRRAALRFAQDKGTRGTRAVLRGAQLDLEKRLAEAEGLKGAGKESFTAVRLRATLEQVRATLRTMAPKLKDTLLSSAKETAEVAAEQTADYLVKADAAFRGVGQQRLSLDSARMVDRAVVGSRASLLRRLIEGVDEPTQPKRKPGEVEDQEDLATRDERKPAKRAVRKGIIARYGENTLEHFEGILQQGLITKKSVGEMRDDLREASPFLQGAPAFWAERIARTEIMGVHNRGAWEASREADDELGDIVKILSATFDDRTAADSYAVHGQIRRPSEAFQTWFGLMQHPPARPNDREIVVTHRISWPLPDYLRWRDDGQVAARWVHERRKGPTPPRPNMTTVPIAQFGKAVPPKVPTKPGDGSKATIEPDGEPKGPDVADGAGG